MTITIDEAISLLSAVEDSPALKYNPEHRDACQLGIEALKRIVYLRKDMDCPHWMTLPGETEEVKAVREVN